MDADPSPSPPPALLFTNDVGDSDADIVDELGARLEFSLNLSMIERVQQRNTEAPPRVQSTGVKQKSFRHLISSHVRRVDNSSEHKKKKKEPSTADQISDDAFKLPPLPRLPSPLASFGTELQWTSANTEGPADILASNNDADPVLPSESVDEQPQALMRQLRRRWSSSMGGGTPQPPPRPPLQRQRSLMFQPVLDVAAVGALIDNIGDQGPQSAPPPSLSAAKEHGASPGPSTTGAKARLMGSLRRATTVIASNRHKIRLLKRRPSAGSTIGIRVIETVQPDENADDNAGENAVEQLPIEVAKEPLPLLPADPSADASSGAQTSPQPAVVRRAGTLNISMLKQPAPDHTAALKRAPTHHGQLQQPVPSSDSAMPGFAPIAVSLKSSRSRQFLLNTPLGEFEVERTLGQGSYGKVKLMRSALTGEQFAVKIIKRYPPHKHRRGHAEYRKAKTLDRRVVREANLSAILGQLHPHIVPLHAFRVTDTHFYLFYAYVSGVTLAERVGGGGLTETEARAVFRPVVETIRFCHQYSVIHRDIKLENVLIDYADEGNDARALLLHQHKDKNLSGNNSDLAAVDYRSASVFDGRVKIIDFGLANFFDGTSLMDTFCGSLPYTAPEILRGDAYVGPEIDVWSLGVLLYVMLTGQFPFEDPAQIKNFDKIMAGDFPLRPSMGRALQDLLVKMLEPNSARRITMQGVLQHEWLADAAPGACCAHHHSHALLADPVHGRRTLLLPGPVVDRAVAREVATCLDRSLDEVTRLLDAAMATAVPAVSPPSTSSGAARHHWPAAALAAQGGTLVEVPNSPVVSVYTLVLQQISMRKYYHELPATEPPCNSSSGGGGISSASTGSIMAYAYGNGGLRDMVEMTPPPLRSSATARSYSLVDRLALQFSHLMSVTGSLVGNHNNNSTVTAAKPPNQSHVAGLANSLVPGPAYMQPLSTGQPQTSTGRKRRLRNSWNSHNTHRHQQRDNIEVPSASSSQLTNRHQPLPPASEPRIRCLGALEELHERIALPSELSSLAIEEVLGLISSLLKMHEIRHTFVETQRMPMHKALDSSSFPLKTMAAMVSSAYISQQPALYALLVDRMTGHKGKFSLFRMFLLRIVAALPAMIPEKFEPRPAADPHITVC
ncbi:Serine/threonine-protein kinase [Coemansia sp. RSA 2320]|nr:Serine/threonine-protein kinase [Coemansia sp. RSA 2320]